MHKNQLSFKWLILKNVFSDSCLEIIFFSALYCERNILLCSLHWVFDFIFVFPQMLSSLHTFKILPSMVLYRRLLQSLQQLDQLHEFYRLIVLLHLSFMSAITLEICNCKAAVICHRLPEICFVLLETVYLRFTYRDLDSFLKYWLFHISRMIEATDHSVQLWS